MGDDALLAAQITAGVNIKNHPGLHHVCLIGMNRCVQFGSDGEVANTDR